MSEKVCKGIIRSESQFQTAPNGQYLSNACGWFAAASAARWSMQNAAYPRGTDLYMRGKQLGQVGDVTGRSDLGQLAYTLAHFDKPGFTIVWPNSGESPLAFMDRMGGVAAVVWMTHNGQALRDFWTSLGEDARDLQNHILTSYGWNTGGASAYSSKDVPAGFVMTDSDSDSQNMKPPALGGVRYHWPLNARLVYYPRNIVIAAQPIGAFAVMPRVAAAQGATMIVPSGWKDDGATLTASNGVAVVKGFRSFMLAYPGGWDHNNTPRGPEYLVTGGSRIDCRYCSLGWTQATNVTILPIGDELAAAKAQIVQLEKTPPLPADYTDAEALAAAVRKIAGVTH